MYPQDRCCHCKMHYYSFSKNYKIPFQSSLVRKRSVTLKEKKEGLTPFSIKDILGLKTEETESTPHAYTEERAEELSSKTKGTNDKDQFTDDEEEEVAKKEKKNERRKKSRTTFTGRQLYELEKRFEKSKYLSRLERQELADILKISHNQVKTWYQNRRTKWKKERRFDEDATVD